MAAFQNLSARRKAVSPWEFSLNRRLYEPRSSSTERTVCIHAWVCNPRIFFRPSLYCVCLAPSDSIQILHEDTNEGRARPFLVRAYSWGRKVFPEEMGRQSPDTFRGNKPAHPLTKVRRRSSSRHITSAERRAQSVPKAATFVPRTSRLRGHAYHELRSYCQPAGR